MLGLAKILWWFLAVVMIGIAVIAGAAAYADGLNLYSLAVVGGCLFFGIIPYTVLAALGLLERQTKAQEDILKLMRGHLGIYTPL